MASLYGSRRNRSSSRRAWSPFSAGGRKIACFWLLYDLWNWLSSDSRRWVCICFWFGWLICFVSYLFACLGSLLLSKLVVLSFLLTYNTVFLLIWTWTSESWQYLLLRCLTWLSCWAGNFPASCLYLASLLAFGLRASCASPSLGSRTGLQFVFVSSGWSRREGRISILDCHCFSIFTTVLAYSCSV